MRIDDVIDLISRISDDFAMVTEVTPEGALRIRWANAAFCAATGYEADELVGLDPGVFAGPDPDAVTWLADARTAERRFRGTLPYHRKDGSVFWGDLTLSPWFDEAGRCTHWVSIVRDITPDMDLRDAFKEAKQEADTARRRLWSAIEALPDAFALFDAQDRMVLHNGPYAGLFGDAAPSVRAGVHFRDLLRKKVADESCPDAQGGGDAWIEARMQHFANPGGPFEQPIPDNRFLRVHEVKLGNGDTVSLAIDITELKRQQQAVERHARALAVAMERAQVAAHTDTLTGLANRRGLDVHLRDLEEQQGARIPVAFLHIDLDRFKQINDMLGHAAGDLVLRKVAGILREAVRPGDHVARVGGDEFAIVFESEDAERIAGGIAERVIRACREPVLFEGRACHFGASIGIAVAPPAAPLGSLMEDADIALYEAKEAGRNRTVCYVPQMRDAAEGEKRLADHLRLALEREEIEAWFQPQVDISSGALVGIEALTRWNHPDMGLLQPHAFMPTAAEIGLAHRIDTHVMRQALAIADGFVARGAAIPRLSLGAGFQRLLHSRIDDELARHARAPFRLAVVLGDVASHGGEADVAIRAVESLREGNVEIEIDDFGSGHASIQTMVHLRPQRIKVDLRKLSPGGAAPGEAGPLLRAIGDMAISLDVGLTASGVATAAQAQAMAEIGCTAIQGALIADPMPAPDLERWLTAHAHGIEARRA